MKKKITALCLCVALLAIAVVGVSLAYLTDTDEAVNTFTVGNIDVVLSENCEVTDSNDKEIEGAVKTEKGVTTFSGLVPSYKITKTPAITNKTESNDAYVRVFVTLSNKNNNFVQALNKAIDDTYGDEKAPEIYNTVFNGWGIHQEKDSGNGWVNRLWMARPADTQVLAVDYTRHFTNYFAGSKNNTFIEGEPERKDGFIYEYYGEESYYAKATTQNSLLYVFYLKLAPGESYTLFNGLNIPADFTAEQLAMFDGLQIGIYADAIQAAGFENYTAAFTALEKEHPLGWWNS